jgi:hypothetical protein
MGEIAGMVLVQDLFKAIDRPQRIRTCQRKIREILHQIQN